MRLEDKLRKLKQAAAGKPTRQSELEHALEYLQRLEAAPKRKLPAQKAAKGIEEYVEGHSRRNAFGEFFFARQALPFGRPYGKLRVSDFSVADLAPLNLFLEGVCLPGPAELVYLDAETTGLAGGTGTCAFLIGIGAMEGTQFVVKQFFLRDYPEEKAALAALADALGSYQGLVTFNGKAFDIPLLETRYALARLKSPFARLVHLDLLHPARRLWKMRLENCQLTNLEREILGIAREGDVPGAEIPGLYFDYLRTGDASGLQPVFFHNALDVITLAALAVEMARIVSESETLTASVDLFSLSRIFERAGARQRSVTTCQRALAGGLPEAVEARALWHLASQHKRQRQYERAVPIWLELSRRQAPWAVEACEALAIYYEHQRGDARSALEFANLALERVAGEASLARHIQRFTHRRSRLQKKLERAASRVHLRLADS